MNVVGKVVGRRKSRRATRAVISLIARYRSLTTFEYVEEPCHDVSTGGMFIESEHPAPAGSLVKIDCATGDHPGRIRAVVRVAWLRRKADDDGPAGMGVRFVRLDPTSHELIEWMQAHAREEGLPKVRASQPPAPRRTDPPRSGDTIPGLAAPHLVEHRPSTEAFPNFGMPQDGANVQSTAHFRRQDAADVSETRERSTQGEADTERTIEQHVAELGAAALSATPAMSDAAAERPIAQALGPSGRVKPPPPPWHTWAWTITFVIAFIGILLSDWFGGAGPERSSRLRFADTPEANANIAQPAVPQQPLVEPAAQAPTELIAPAPRVSAAPTSANAPPLPALAGLADANRYAVSKQKDALPATPRVSSHAVSAQPAPTAPAQPSNDESTAAAKARGSALDIARACLAQADNACVIAALDGKAKSAAEYELLIETLRSVGRSADAQKAMASYVQRFPDERRATGYRRMLEARTAPKAEAQVPAPPPAVPAREAPEARAP